MKFLVLLAVSFALIGSLPSLLEAREFSGDLRCVSNRGYNSEFLLKISADSLEAISFSTASAKVKFARDESSEGVKITGSSDQKTYSLTLSHVGRSKRIPAEGIFTISYDPEVTNLEATSTVNPVTCCATGYPLFSAHGNSYCEKDKIKSRAALLNEFKEIFSTKLQPEATAAVRSF